MTVLTVADMRAAGICKHARLWFERHNLDWRRFVHHGMTAEELRGPGDIPDLIDRVESAALKREARDGKK